MCTCRYLSVAKNKRLRVFIVPREHLDEVGGYHSVERWLVTMCLLMADDCFTAKHTKWSTIV